MAVAVPFPYRAKDDDELWMALVGTFGLRYPRQAVCPGHQAPFQALADAYFARYPVLVIWASRGFGGKSTLLAGLSLMELLAGADVVLLGGSSHQSRRVHEVCRLAWQFRAGEVEAPTTYVGRITQYHTETVAGNWMRALTASTTSVRGPHPNRLRLDEVDEMDLELLDAALGQPIESRGIPSQTVLSSTLQYAEGTFREVLRRAEAKGWPVYRWCYRETSVDNGGWVTHQMVQEAQHRVTRRMWELEYELGEPEPEGAALGLEVLAQVFRGGWIEDRMGVRYILEPPEEEGRYVVAADWARDVDTTVIVVLRQEGDTARLVAYERTAREPWPKMVKRYEELVTLYGATAIHDATGVGGVVEDYLQIRAIPFTITGRSKTELYSNYVLALEHGKLTLPRIRSLYEEHRHLTNDALFGNEHTPDGVVALALAWSVVSGKSKLPGGRVVGIGRF